MKTIKDLQELVDSFGGIMLLMITTNEMEWRIAASCYSNELCQEDDYVVALKGSGNDIEKMINDAYGMIEKYKKKRFS